MRRTKLSCLLTVLSLLGLLASMSEADDSFQEAIAAAEEGAVMAVPSGTLKSPLTIEKPLTLKGEGPEKSVLEVTADRPAILTTGRGPIVIEGLTIKWQLATSDAPRDDASAFIVHDAEVTVKNCRFIATGNAKQSPAAAWVTGFSKVNLENCHFDGFEFTIGYSGGAEGKITDCVIANPGHCGATVYSGSTLEVARCLVTGSKFHGLRCTGGTLKAHDNLIIGNKNRGIYLGNKSASGRMDNNVIHSNGTGISAFGRSEVLIENNVFLDCDFSGFDTRDSCPISVRNNIFQGNTHGVIQFEDAGRSSVTLEANCLWQNETNAKGITPPETTLLVDPQFADADVGDFSVKSADVAARQMGLTDASVFTRLWKKWTELKR